MEKGFQTCSHDDGLKEFNGQELERYTSPSSGNKALRNALKYELIAGKTYQTRTTILQVHETQRRRVVKNQAKIS